MNPKELQSDKPHRKIHGGLIFISLINLLGFGYLAYATFQQKHALEIVSKLQTQNIDKNDEHLAIIRESQLKLSKDLLALQQKVASSPGPKARLEHMKWLIQQASWQLNVMNQPQSAQQLLLIAKRISNKQHWINIEAAIDNDLSALNNIHITESTILIAQINQLRQTITSLHPLENLVKTKPKASASLPDYLNALKPFVYIEHLPNKETTIVPPSEQYINLQNIQLLLPQIQYAALTHQQNLYLQLVEQLGQLASVFKQPDIEQAINTLKQNQFQLEEPIHFQSISLVHQQLRQESHND